MTNHWKVLVAESNAGPAAELAAALRQGGCEVVLATDAVAVMTLALRHKPQAVVLGAQLHAGGAQLALRRLRSSVHTASIPIVALAETAAQKQALLAAGAEECVDLPIDATEIIATIEQRLGAGTRVKGAPAEILAEPGRLAALEKTGMLDSDPDEELDILTRLAARLLKVPVALISLVDGQRQFFKSQIGLPEPWDALRQTPLSHSFCQWVVSSDEELVVADAREHPVLCTNGAVADLGVIAYAGVPLSAVSGEIVGSFCAIDGKPRVWSREDLATLRDLGQIVDSYSALNQARACAHETDPDNIRSRSTARAAGRGFVGAARLLRCHGELAEVRAVLIGTLERLGHQLAEVADNPADLRKAA